MKKGYICHEKVPIYRDIIGSNLYAEVENGNYKK